MERREKEDSLVPKKLFEKFERDQNLSCFHVKEDKSQSVSNREGYSMVFRSPRTSTLMFECELNDSNAADASAHSDEFRQHAQVLVEDTFCDADPDNNEYDENNMEDVDYKRENSLVFDLQLPLLKFKDESKSDSTSSKGNSLELKNLKERNRSSDFCYVPETVPDRITSVSESPLADETVIISETMSSEDVNPYTVMSSAARNQFLLKTSFETTDGEESPEVIAETAPDDIPNSSYDRTKSVSQGTSDIKEEERTEVNDLTDLFNDQLPGEETETVKTGEKEAVTNSSPDSEVQSPSVFQIPHDDEECDRIEPNNQQLQVNKTDLVHTLSEKCASVDLYNQETLDVDSLGEEDLHLHQSAAAEMKQNEEENVAYGAVEVVSPESRPARTSLTEVDFSDEDGEDSIMTSSQKDLANKTILSINTPMQDRS